MSDELMLQYERLEQKVAERTQELEISKVSFIQTPFNVPTDLCHWKINC
jgi:nitrate/nitrite-specific signal transduction histidine kinase